MGGDLEYNHMHKPGCQFILTFDVQIIAAEYEDPSLLVSNRD